MLEKCFVIITSYGMNKQEDKKNRKERCKKEFRFYVNFKDNNFAMNILSENIGVSIFYTF